jgi:hypothetical protein
MAVMAYFAFLFKILAIERKMILYATLANAAGTNFLARVLRQQ